MLLTRFMFGGSLRPDSAWEPRADRAGHVLPGVLQLRHEMSQAQALFTTHSDVYKTIAAKPRVKDSKNPAASALAIFLMDAETRIMNKVVQIIHQRGGRVLSVVFDGVYVWGDTLEAVKDLYKSVAAEAYDGMGIKLSLKDSEGNKVEEFQE